MQLNVILGVSPGPVSSLYSSYWRFDKIIHMCILTTYCEKAIPTLLLIRPHKFYFCLEFRIMFHGQIFVTITQSHHFYLIFFYFLECLHHICFPSQMSCWRKSAKNTEFIFVKFDIRYLERTEKQGKQDKEKKKVWQAGGKCEKLVGRVDK